jgi:predicted lactoylglutathione lyase
MFDHLTLHVNDLAASRAFYTTTLASLGYKVVMTINDGSGVHAFGKWQPQFWLAPACKDKQKPVSGPTHIAFSAKNRAQVDAFYDAGMKAGGKSNGAPGVREHYHKFYYGCFLYDLDGNNIECVCHWPPSLLMMTSWPVLVFGGIGGLSIVLLTILRGYF